MKPENGVTEADISYFETRFRRSTVFWQRALSILHGLPEQEYFSKRTGLRKKFMEEILPLAILARNLECPGRIVSCKYSGRGHGRDASLSLKGSRNDDPPFIEVEIVSAEPTHAFLHREALRIHGTAFAGPNIKQYGSDNRKNKRIVSEPFVTDPETQYKANLNLIRCAVDKKSSTKRRENMLLLINFLPEMFLTDGEWLDFIVASRNIVADSGFKGIYLSYVERAWTYRLAGSI